MSWSMTTNVEKWWVRGKGGLDTAEKRALVVRALRALADGPNAFGVAVIGSR